MTKPDSFQKKFTSWDKRLQAQVSAREIPVGHTKKFSTVRIKYKNRIPRKAMKPPALEIFIKNKTKQNTTHHKKPTKLD